MASKKTASLTSGLVASKPSASAPAPSKHVAREAAGDAGANVIPLNFRVSAEFRRQFRTYAAVHDMKLNELFMIVAEDYMRRNP